MQSRRVTGNKKPISETHPRSPVTEAYRTLRTNIEFASVVRNAKVLLVTSSIPSEGKTSTATNLAVVAAQAGRKVLLVDADMRKPQVHQRFHVSNLDGLTSVVIRERSTEQCLATSGTPGLFLLTSGAIPPNPSELLASERFAQLVAEWKSEYDLVILDAPPVLSVADALQLSRTAEGVILVLDTRRTARAVAQRAVQALRQVEAPLLGVVMNRLDQKKAESYYYYYYSSDTRLTM